MAKDKKGFILYCDVIHTVEKLDDWGLDIPNFNNVDYSEKNEEIDIDSLDETMTIKLNFTETEYWTVKQQLSEIAATPEQAIWKLLGNE